MHLASKIIFTLLSLIKASSLNNEELFKMT